MVFTTSFLTHCRTLIQKKYYHLSHIYRDIYSFLPKIIEKNKKVSIEDLLQGDQFNDVNIKIASPTLVVPLSNYNDPSSPCWVLRLGDVELMSQKNQLDFDIQIIHPESSQLNEIYYESPIMTKNIADDTENKRSPKKKINESVLYDLFDISLRDIQIQYYSSVEFFSSKQSNFPIHL